MLIEKHDSVFFDKISPSRSVARGEFGKSKGNQGSDPEDFLYCRLRVWESRFVSNGDLSTLT